MNRTNTLIIVLFATVGLATLGVLALCGSFLVSALPHLLHGKSALDVPANPNMTVDDYNRRGNDLYEQHLYKRAATEYGHMIEKEPRYAFGYLLRGMAEDRADDYRKAVRDYTDGLKYARETIQRDNLYFNRGLAYRKMGDFKHALPDLTQAIALKPDNWEAYPLRAFCYTALGNCDRAIADYTVAIGHNPHPGIIFERGQAYLNKKDYRRALADLNRSIAANPNFVPGYRLRAGAYVGLKEYDRAVADAEAALQRDHSALSQGNLGWYQYLAGKLPESIANSQAAIKMDPVTTTYARFNLGLCYAVQGNADAAKSAYQDALQHAQAFNVRASLQEVRDALAKQPDSPALKQAETLLQNALPHAATTP